MVIVAPATMEEGRILLVGNESDILHSAHSFPLNESGKRYPSADHYAHAQILTQLGLDEVLILELLATSAGNVPKKARELLQENMPQGHDMNSLAQYLVTSRQSYTMMGLRLRAEQDKRFRQTLVETGDALLIVCDRRDPELGIGMDDETFVGFARRRHANADRISAWMHDEKQRPRELGQNQLGFFLMWLRYELKEKEKAKWLSTVEIKIEGLSTDQDDQPMEISVSDFALALQGIFQPLSNYYALPFDLKGETYRSVEHYAYQRLFEALKLPFEDVMKLRTTVKPADLMKVAARIYKHKNIDETEVTHKSSRLDRWRQSAMKHKITKNEYLRNLLLSTGHAILLETTAEGDPQWVIGTDEFEIQHLLGKKYIQPQLLVQWMCGRAKVPPALAHLGGNKTGLLLMELRAKLASDSTHRMPLIAPLTSSVIRSSVSNHMICLTPESVLHPFYPAEIHLPSVPEPFPTSAHLAAQMAIKFLGVNRSDAEWIQETRDGHECWERLHTVVCEQMQLPLEKIQQWYMEERQRVLKEAMKLQFEQHPALMRVLLDTQDALLVCCARFSAVEAEMNIGMRERDLRLWLAHVRQDTKQLIDICLRPMAFRPPFLGGNRLGLMLMELRREFILAGVFPHQLPELALSVDSLLGSDSPMENFVVTASEPFNVLDEANFSAIWANPYLLMVKQQEGASPAESEQNWTHALSRKLHPMLISRDDALIETFFQHMFLGDNGPMENGNGTTPLENGDAKHQLSLDELAPEALRAVYMRMSAQFRMKLADLDEMQRQIAVRGRDSSRLQDMRRALERTRDQNLGVVSDKPGEVIRMVLPILHMQNEKRDGNDQVSSAAGALAPTAADDPSGAQWTQAAAVSSGRRPPSPPPNARPAATPMISAHPPYRQQRDEQMMPKGGGIPSLLGPDFHQQQQHLPPPQQRRTSPPPSYRREHQPPYGGGPPTDHRRGGRWERPSGGGIHRGKRGAPGGRGAYDRSQSPPAYGARRGGARIPVSPVRAGGASATEQHRQRPSSSHQQQRTPAATEQKPPTGPAAAAEQKTEPPAVKRPKRVVDEAELSEGEIISDEDD